MNIRETAVETISVAFLAVCSIGALLALGLFVRGAWEGFLLGYTLFGYLP